MDSRELVIKILNCEDKNTQRMLYGWYKPQLSPAQIEFIDTKLGLKFDPLIYGQQLMGGKISKIED